MAGRPVIGLRGVLGKMKLPVERVLHIDHLLLMQGLNTYEAKTKARAGSNLPRYCCRQIGAKAAAYPALFVCVESPIRSIRTFVPGFRCAAVAASNNRGGSP